MAAVAKFSKNFLRGDRSWMGDRALCKGSFGHLFFPPGRGVEHQEAREPREEEAKKICAECPLEEPCLEYAFSTKEPDGIWGGMTGKERRQTLKRRARKAARQNK